MGAFAEAATPTCKAEIRKSLEILSQRSAGAKTPDPARKSCGVLLTCWKDTPQSLQGLLAEVAGLSDRVVGKRDRDLTEEEKAALRRAIGKVRDRIARLVAL